MTTLCAANHVQQLVAVFLLTALAFGGCVQPQLQQGSTTTTTHSYLIHKVTFTPTFTSTSYPAAGYRPKIPFDLPRTSTSSSMKEIDINIETLDESTTTATTTTTTNKNYITPNLVVENENVTNMKVDLVEMEEVINAPIEHLQAPKPAAAKNFNTLDDFIKDNANIGTDDASLFSVEPQPRLNVFNIQIPASTYGTPNPMDMLASNLSQKMNWQRK